MGILSSILESLAVGIAKVAIAGGGALARIAVRVAAEVKPRIVAAVQAARDEWNRRQRERSGAINSVNIADAKLEILDVNNRLARLAGIYRTRGLSSREHDQRIELIHRRGELIGLLQGSDEMRIAESITDHEEEYAAITIDDSTSHLLQSTVGQTIYGKKCPKCGWQMQLQWNRMKTAVGTADFGWGCTGWYWPGKSGTPHLCNHWEELDPNDFDIFARAKRPEYAELTAPEFSKIVLNHSDHVIERFEAVRNNNRASPTEVYRCPVHGEPLVLQKKKENGGRLLDMYFLGCPRWQPQEQGCQYIVKLKSPAQLNAYLEASTGEVII